MCLPPLCSSFSLKSFFQLRLCIAMAKWSFFNGLTIALSFISLTQAVQHKVHHTHKSHNHQTHSLENSTVNSNDLFGRQLGDARCDAHNECADKSCCNGVTGWCGRDPDHCAAGICLSNCDAKADCGVGAEVPGQLCPLNVCCGASGYCGTTKNFCAADNGCQSNCDQPGPTGANRGNVRDLVIGYAFCVEVVLYRGTDIRQVLGRLVTEYQRLQQALD